MPGLKSLGSQTKTEIIWDHGVFENMTGQPNKLFSKRNFLDNA
jgi:hypothetical protein